MVMGFAHTIDVLTVYLLSSCLSIDPSEYENEMRRKICTVTSAYINRV